MKRILPIITIVSMSVAAALHAESSLQTSAYRNSIAQDELRKRAEDVRQQLVLVLEDIRQNQADTPEAELAARTAKKLLSLGDDQLLPLVQTLKDASTTEDSTKVLGRLTEASKEQKNIQILLKSMADGLSLYKDQATIQQRLQQLVLRQITNIRQTRGIAPTGKPAELASLCQSEQTALAREVEATFETLQRIADGATDSDKAKFAAAFEAMKASNTPALAAAAATETSSGKYASALAAQTSLLGALQTVLSKFSASLPPQDRARSLAAQITEMASQQASLAETIRNAPASARRDMRETQLQAMDRIASIQQQVQDLNAAAAGMTSQAGEAMDKATEALKGSPARKAEEIASLQNASAQNLKQAAEELTRTADQLSKAQEPQNAAQTMSDLAQLSQEITAAQAQQNALGANPASSPEQQKELASRTEKLQQEALSHNEKAAQRLGEAVEKMRGNDSKEASQALAEANAEIQSQMQAVAKAAAQEQQLRAVSNKIAEARSAAADALADMQAAQAGQAQMSAIKKSENAQAALEQAKQLASTTGAPGEVKAALQQAQAALEKSKLDAAQKKKDSAMQANLAAQKNLESAQQSLQQSAADALASAMQKQPSSRQPAPQSAIGPAIDGKSGEGAGAVAGGEASAQGGASLVQNASGLKPREREAVALLQKESAPAEYKNMAGQYLKNLGLGVSPATSLPQ